MMNPDKLKQRQAELEQKLAETRRQLQELRNAEQQLVGALLILGELLQLDAPQPVDNAAK